MSYGDQPKLIKPVSGCRCGGKGGEKTELSVARFGYNVFTWTRFCGNVFTWDSHLLNKHFFAVKASAIQRKSCPCITEKRKATLKAYTTSTQALYEHQQIWYVTNLTFI